MYDIILNKLEFPQILDRLAASCRFNLAAERARELGPTGNISDVTYLLNVTSEAVDLITSFPDITIGGARDIRDLVQRATKGARLLPADLLLVLDMVSAARNLRRSFFRLPDAETRFAELSDFVEQVADFPDLEADINRTIGPRGDVLDTASPELGRIRREVRVAHGRLMDRINGMLTGGRLGAAVQDSIVTMRDGRYVIPIKAEARSQVPGVVHDTSASGQTLFIEPLAVVELNNKWRELQIAEQHEIDRVLDILSQRIADRAEPLQLTVEAMAAIDLAMAKARLAFDMHANRPTLWQGAATDPDGHASHRISLVRARHPLLDPATVVPIDVHVGEHYRVLLITGPNTGGKTVALKTVGLLTLMTQTGLFIPADASSVVSVFPAIFADIGDEQSIAQSLSTFSAHMRTVIDMLEHVTADSLVLLDELGAGTDPQEGSALARALISALLERGAMVIATTHYSEVKAYAYATPGVENASVEFDVKTLSPTYRLMIGVPGQSNALAIARRLGMPGDIINEARSLLSPDEARVENLLQDIKKRRQDVDAALERARAVERDAQQLRRLAARQLRQAEEERQTAREDALAEAESALEEAREALRRLQRDRDLVTVTRDHVQQRKREVDEAASAIRGFRRERIPRPTPIPGERPIRPGDRALVTTLGQEGDVLQVSDGTAEVQMGSLKLRQPLTALRRVQREQEAPAIRTPAPAVAQMVPIEIDLRGQRPVEIEGYLERYLDDAYRSGLPFVRIIHGKGTGALRQAVRSQLSGHPLVDKYELAPQSEGGEGATIAHLRQH